MQEAWFNRTPGTIELRAHDPVRLGLVWVFPDRDAEKVTVETTLENTTGRSWPGTLFLSVRDAAWRLVAHKEISVDITGQSLVAEPDVTLKQRPCAWDDFSPTLYTVELRLSGQNTDSRRRTRFGFRTIENADHRFLCQRSPHIYAAASGLCPNLMVTALALVPKE